MEARDDEPLFPGYAERLGQLGLLPADLERVTELLVQVRAETTTAYVKKLDRAVELLREARGERDRVIGVCAVLQARLDKVEEVATARDYMPPYRRVPRFTLPGAEVLIALGVYGRYER